MRIFLAGASGIIGERLLPILIADGHRVAGMTRTAGKAGKISGSGGFAVVCDVFDVKGLMEAVVSFHPDFVWSQLTDLPDDPLLIPEHGLANNRIRTEGTDNLLRAAAAVRSRVIAQSVAWQLPGAGGTAVSHLEERVLAAKGVVIRYGQFYGPGTYYQTEKPDHPRIHIDEAAQRSLAALALKGGLLTIKEE